MFKKIVLAVMVFSMIGCAQLKKKLGTGEETPELKAARTECRTQADKEALAKYENVIRRKDYARKAFDVCMDRKGYDRYGKKVR